MKKNILIIFILFFVSIVLVSFSKNPSKKIQGTIVIANNEPFTYPVLKSDDGILYKIYCEKNKDRESFFDLQGKKIQIKGYIQEDEIYGLVIYPSSWKILKY